MIRRVRAKKKRKKKPPNDLSSPASLPAHVTPVCWAAIHVWVLLPVRYPMKKQLWVPTDDAGGKETCRVQVGIHQYLHCIYSLLWRGEKTETTPWTSFFEPCHGQSRLHRDRGRYMALLQLFGARSWPRFSDAGSSDPALLPEKKRRSHRGRGGAGTVESRRCQTCDGADNEHTRRTMALRRICFHRDHKNESGLVRCTAVSSSYRRPFVAC